MDTSDSPIITAIPTTDPDATVTITETTFMTHASPVMLGVPGTHQYITGTGLAETDVDVGTATSFKFNIAVPSVDAHIAERHRTINIEITGLSSTGPIRTVRSYRMNKCFISGSYDISSKTILIVVRPFSERYDPLTLNSDIYDTIRIRDLPSFSVHVNRWASAIYIFRRKPSIHNLLSVRELDGGAATFAFFK